MLSNSLTVFRFNNNEIRFIDGKPIANDVAKVLGYAHPAKTVSTKVSSKNKGLTKMETPGGMQSVTVLEEAGIYQLIFSSKLETAQEFQQWVFENVLPSIRKTGQYSVQPKTALELAKEQVKLLEEMERLEKEKQLLEVQNELLEEENEQLSETVDELFDYSSIIRVAKYNKVCETNFNWRALKAASKQLGLEVKKVPCPRFVTKNLYLHDAWRLAYPKMRLPETTTLVIQN
ncbi:BRO family protein [Crocosphaera sp.]|uniref:BRO-N domain-containing protein n=1 Tax=Crocosphaera sp. TaxID=2729996 RepID=UPI002638B7A0|nr:BRO family protein [Crocosphaera sp.]MDJ0579095.1 BRO family protein [Crocosphaera sp.]